MIFSDFQALPAAKVDILVYSFPRSSGRLATPDLHWRLRHDPHDSRTFDFFDVSISETRWLVFMSLLLYGSEIESNQAKNSHFQPESFVTIVNNFLKSWVNIFGPDLLYSLSHGSHDSRTFDFFDVSVSETRWLVISDFFDVFWLIYGHQITWILDFGATDIGKSMNFPIWHDFDRL